MHILIASDAWQPQVNGVVRSLESLQREAPALGAKISVLSHNGFRTLGLPFYSEIRVAITPLLRPSLIAQKIETLAPDAIHIATEGPIGVAVRRFCLQNGRPFTSSYHTRFPEYLAARLPVPQKMTYAWLRRFHNAGSGIMVATPSLEQELRSRGFKKLMRWGRGVDADLFRPRETRTLDVQQPVFLYVGRVAVEKNLPAFLSLDLPGTKVVVGDGPQLQELKAAYPQAVFLGKKSGEALAEIYANADVFVFPSRTDTFGIVLLEALSCGVPVAAYPVTGPGDVIRQGETGILHEDLHQSCMQALHISREVCRSYAKTQSWRASAQQFIENVKSVNLELKNAQAVPA
jgi:glycosyltransferase involved in cell wall biosynthesis